MILLHRRDRLGNWMFEYCFARVLTRRFGYRLAALPMPGFPGTFAEISGEEVYGPGVCWQGNWPFDAHSGRRLAKEELFQAPGQRLTLSYAYQRFELIADAREEIREDWLRVEGACPVRRSGDFLICLRLGDVYSTADKTVEGEQGAKWSDGVLNEAEIRRLVRTVPHERLYILTDAPRHPLLAAVRDLGAEIFSAGGMEDFRFIHSFQKVAICQSTFHWWAAFLGAAREIYFPPCNRGVWSHPEPAQLADEPGHYGIDLRVDEERCVYDW